MKDDRSCEWHADNALDPEIAARVMFRGMIEGWFRSGHHLLRYFSDTANDAFNAREIINGDRNTVPSWSGGMSIGNLIKQYHYAFLSAVEESIVDEIEPVKLPVELSIRLPPGVVITIYINDVDVVQDYEVVEE